MSTSEQHFIQRQPHKSDDEARVSALMICAERPNVESIDHVIDLIVDSAPVVIAEDLNAIRSLKKELDKPTFESKIKILADRIQTLADSQNWSPSPELQNQLHQIHLTSIDEVAEENNWLDNFILQIRSIRFSHLRNVAKKGTDLDGTVHFEPKFTPVDDPNAVGRVKAAIEVLGAGNIEAQAEDILQSAMQKEYTSQRPIKIHCMRPVRDHESSQNSYNFQTATYAMLLRKALEKVASEKYPEQFEIIDSPAVMLTFTNRTNASLFGRILKQPVFDVGNVDNANVVIIDDHINAGGFSATLASQVAQAGGNVLSIAMFSRHPQSKSLLGDARAIEFLCELYPKEALNKLLAPVGLSLETISSREAMTLLAVLIDGEDHVKIDRFLQLDKELSSPHTHITHGINDDMIVELKKPAETLPKLSEAYTRDDFQSS